MTIKETPSFVLEKSRMHCHARGLHSIVLSDKPGKMVRLFAADETHELWKNDRDLFPNPDMSVGFHAHHCDLSLACTSGVLANWWVALPKQYRGFCRDRCGEWPVAAYRYHSALRDETPGFEFLGERIVSTVSYDLIEPGGLVYLGASALHTVFVEKGKRASWIVREYAEDPTYSPLTFSPNDLTLFDFTGMYQPMTEQEALSLLAWACPNGVQAGRRRAEWNVKKGGSR